MANAMTHRSAVKTLSARVRAAYPNAEHVGGIGYCGTDWRAAQAMWDAGIRAIDHLTDISEAVAR